jgi:gamma-glutamylcyclotransferase (GGCT)/AIG2-like uncharacterized protein YtfP
MEIVFVYGSLKRGYALHKVLSGATYLGAATTLPLYRLYDCGDYPGMVHHADNGVSIHGELYDVDAACLQRLDEVEGVAEGLYSREPVELRAPLPDSNADSPAVDPQSSVAPTAGLAGSGVISGDCVGDSGCVWGYFYLLSTSGLPDCGECWP